MEKIRFGILGTAGIARKNWLAISSSGNCVVTAVASRDIERSRQFIAECQARAPFENPPVPLGSYEELLASINVDAVYIPLPTGLRQEWVLRAAQAGKHVVCEKPCGVSLADVREMTDACKKNNVQFMDGVMFMHSPRLARVREFLDDSQSVGPVRRISSAFSYAGVEGFFQDNIRVDGRLEPAGCLGDLGWYCLRFSLWAMNWRLPRAVAGRILSQSAGGSGAVPTPTEFSGELLFDGGVSAGFYCSFLAPNQQWASVNGQKGWLRLPDFVHPYDSREPAFEVNRNEIRLRAGVGAPAPAALSDPGEMGHPTSQDTQMFRNFANQVFSGKLDDDWPMWSLKTQQVQDACYASARKGSETRL